LRQCLSAALCLNHHEYRKNLNEAEKPRRGKVWYVSKAEKHQLMNPKRQNFKVRHPSPKHFPIFAVGAVKILHNFTANQKCISHVFSFTDADFITLERVGISVNRLRTANFTLHIAKIFSHSAAMTKNLWLVQHEIFSLSLDRENPNTL
jgi:hypothetical protein